MVFSNFIVMCLGLFFFFFSVCSLEFVEFLVSINLSFTKSGDFSGIISVNVRSVPIWSASALGTPVAQM